jgi:hypothetical protein
MHGTYGHSNLFEGNDVDCHIDLDNHWGEQGPYNTIFRNRVVDDTLHYIRRHRDNSVRPYASYLNILGNTALAIMGGVGCDYEDGTCYSIDGGADPSPARITNLWVERNVYRDLRSGAQCTASGDPHSCCAEGGDGSDCAFGFLADYATTELGDGAGLANFPGDNAAGNRWPPAWSGFDLPASLYRSSAPTWWCAETPWPAIGADTDDFGVSVNALAAQRRRAGLPCTLGGPASIP